MVLGFELRASWLLGRLSTTWAIPPVQGDFEQLILMLLRRGGVVESDFLDSNSDFPTY
jgi:hypothetical protein